MILELGFEDVLSDVSKVKVVAVVAVAPAEIEVEYSDVPTELFSEMDIISRKKESVDDLSTSNIFSGRRSLFFSRKPFSTRD